MSSATGGDASALAAGERRWGLAAAISSIAVFGLGIGLSAPLLALLLEERGTDASLNGLNATATFLGVIFGPLLTPPLVRRLGFRTFLLAALAADAGLFLLMKIFDGLVAWFVLRAALGLVGSSIFTTTEAWISGAATDAQRGRIIGVYAAALSAGFGTGPLLLSLTGFAGWTPFIANACIAALAAIPIALVRTAPESGSGDAPMSPLAVFRRAPVILLAVALFGVFESTAISLLPVWGVRRGLDQGLAAATITLFYFGAIALQVPVGWLSDRIRRFAMLRLCCLAGLVGAVLLLMLPATSLPMYLCLFLWGGLASGIYPVALSMAGDRFRGAELLAANAALVMGYGIGSLAGPALGGAAMDLWNPDGLLALFALVFAFFLAATRGRWAEAEARRKPFR